MFVCIVGERDERNGLKQKLAGRAGVETARGNAASFFVKCLLNKSAGSSGFCSSLLFVP